MYDYTTYRDFISAVRSTSNIYDFRSAVRNYLNDSAMQWWRKLQENERQAIILLDFNPSVVTTMVFFSGCDWGFGGSYNDVLNVILHKAALLDEEEQQGDWSNSFRAIIEYARAQAQAEQEARAKAAAIAQEMNLVAGYNILENLLVENSGAVRNNKKYKIECAKNMRKAFLDDALNYLRKNYNKEEGE